MRMQVHQEMDVNCNIAMCSLTQLHEMTVICFYVVFFSIEERSSVRTLFGFPSLCPQVMTHLSWPAALHRAGPRSSYQVTAVHELCSSVFLFFSLPVHLFSLDGIGQQSRPLCPVMGHTIADPLWTHREINDILISNIPHSGASLTRCYCYHTKILLRIFFRE